MLKLESGWSEAVWAFFAVLLLALLPLAVQDAYIRHMFIVAFIYAAVASNWDFSMGYGGIFNLAHVGIFGAGAYTVAILTKLMGFDPWLAMLCASVTGTILAAILVVPVLRLRGIYVILVTFAFSELILRLILSQRHLTGGATGMVGLPSLKIGGYNFALDGKFAYYYVGLLLLVGSTVFLRAITRSAFGLSVVALKDDENYAVSRGVSKAKTRLFTLACSGVFTGLAGGFYAVYMRVASPDLFGFGLITFILSMVVFGGMGTIYGPIIGCFLLVAVSEAFFEWGPWRYIINAGVIILVLVAAPGGVVGVVRHLGRWAEAERFPLMGDRKGRSAAAE